jgi:TRAP-type uncharacterized transport system fused permease subunit
MITAICGMWGVSVSMIGFCTTLLNPIQRLLFFIGGILLIDPGTMTDIIGIVILVATYFWQKQNKNKGPLKNEGD